MVRILHINDYPIGTGGGAEVVLAQTLSILRRHGVPFDTFTCADLASPRRTPLRYVDNRVARRALADKLHSFRPDVVHLHNYYHVLSPGILATLGEFKSQHPLRVVMTAHDYHLICPNAGGSWFRWLTRRRESVDAARVRSLSSVAAHRWDDRTYLHSLLKLAQHAWNYRWHHRRAVIDLVICPSRFVQGMLEGTGLATAHLPHPVPPLPRVPSVRTGPLQFVFAGRVESEKGLNEFLNLLPPEFDAQLTIVGEGAELSACQATCAARGWNDRVRFVGRLTHPQTLARIAASHVLVQPSRVLETYGLTLIEALSQGTNILAVRRGAAPEIVEATGVGFLFEPDDQASLAEQLRAIHGHFESGALNRFDIASFVEERSEARYLDGLLRIYQIPGVVAA